MSDPADTVGSFIKFNVIELVVEELQFKGFLEASNVKITDPESTSP